VPSWLESALGWAVVLGLVGGFLLARRRQREAVAGAIAAARAEGHAAALAAVQATQHVNVAVDASRRGRSEVEHLAWSDGFRAAVAAGSGVRGLPASDDSAAIYGTADYVDAGGDSGVDGLDFIRRSDSGDARDRWAAAAGLDAVPVHRVIGKGRVP